jgi:hypothetical protein
VTPEQFAQAKATMPWTERYLQTPRGGLLQILDRNGQEVPFTVMCGVLRIVTQKLARETAAAPTNPEPGAST